MSAISINVEPFDPETMEECTSPRNEKKSQEDKRSCVGCCGMSRRLMIICIITACATLLLGAGLTAYFLIDPKPEPPITPPPTPPSTTSAPPSVPPDVTTTATVTQSITTGSPPTTITTGSPSTTSTADPPTTSPKPIECFPIQWIKDETVRPADKDPWRVSLFSGQLCQARMLKVCDKIDKALADKNWDQTGKWNGAVSLSTNEDEASFDKIIRENINNSSSASLDSIFGNRPNADQRLLWTGCYYQRVPENEHIWRAECRTPFKDYENFCNATGWAKELEELQATAGPNHLIYIVKDYRENKGCWKLFLSKQIAEILRDPFNIPKLSFACITADNPLTSGKGAIELAKLNLCKKYTN